MINVNSEIVKKECKEYFMNNPYSIETINSLSRKIGRNETEIKNVIVSLKKDNLIINVNKGSELYYKKNNLNATKHPIKHETLSFSTIKILEDKEKDVITNLTNRESEVFHCLLKGYSSNQIAEQLFITNHTVKNHVTNIYRKLQVSDRAKLIAKYYRLIRS
ncbi:response regulator transcription factor [Aquibacillus rhizosphaerae]|uniref:LuxR C-terminal-related transcriptional regulator n=1 Tax=Aquibacillus rhizosphaerae TaxID=3051431 RepID=A0ABT7LBG9_9BACI|nr:LuxR C-terminal-related transcriptional regulator [Aquibacillus sp. LR5S19]MDL4843210.1 LuxR C-terminal-related transcriptional regulator [Aquibacillus sp. LR5S19]